MRIFLGAVALFLLFEVMVNPGQAGNYGGIMVVEALKPVQVREEKLDKKELECMASNIYFEAATQSRAGKIAVAQVTMNRVFSAEFPDSVCGVVFQGPKVAKNKLACQFSWFCDGKPDVVRSKRLWRECIYIAKYVMKGGVPDITYSSTHYHAHYVDPWWSKKMERTIVLGDHIFYR